VVISACEQSGRAIVPEIKMPLSLDKWLAADAGSTRLFLDPQAGNGLSAIDLEGDTVSILVGPEGGFSSEEIRKIDANGVRPASLGPRVLRTETAGPAAISVLQIAAGDF
jgi:16S rRNA (uracil1498-N3)-methyltransferase